MQCRSQAVAPSKSQDTPAVRPGPAPQATLSPRAQVTPTADDSVEVPSAAQAGMAAVSGANLPALRIPSPARAVSVKSFPVLSPCASSPGSSASPFSSASGPGFSAGAFSPASMSAAGLSPWASEPGSPPDSPISPVAPVHEGPLAAPEPQGFLARLRSAATVAWSATQAAFARAGQYLSHQVAWLFSARPRS